MAINHVMSRVEIDKATQKELLDAVKQRNGTLVAKLAKPFLIDENMVIINQGNRRASCLCSVTREIGVLMQDGKNNRAWRLDGTEYDVKEILQHE